MKLNRIFLQHTKDHAESCPALEGFKCNCGAVVQDDSEFYEFEDRDQDQEPINQGVDDEPWTREN